MAPPGIIFLARHSFILSLPIFVVSGLRFLVLSILENRHSEAKVKISYGSWFMIIVAGAISMPAYHCVRIWWNDMTQKRLASLLNARVVPKAQGKRWGNLDIGEILRNTWKNGYPDDWLPQVLTNPDRIINFHVLGFDAIFTDSPDHVHLILSTEFQNYVKGPKFHEAMYSVLGNGVFNVDGDLWKFHRSMTRPFFSRDRVTHFELFDRHAEVAIKKLKARAQEGYAVDIQDVMSRFTLDSATEFLFGSCVHSLSSSDLAYPYNIFPQPTKPGDASQGYKTKNFSQALLAAQNQIARRERLAWAWPLFEFFEDKTKDPMRVVDAYLEPIIQEALKKQKFSASGIHAGPHSEQSEGILEEETLLDHLVKLTPDRSFLKDEILNIMIAGKDSTAATLSFIVYFLAMYPDVFHRLREEIIKKVGFAHQPSLEELRELRYLRAVINETLRLYPIVPYNIRETVKVATLPSTIPNGKPFLVPANTRVIYSVFTMHRRVDLWGPDANEFDPDRFLDERLQKYLTPNPFIFLPFNAGPRICLGQQFAYNEISLMIIRLLQNFSSFVLDPEACPPVDRPPAEWRIGTGRKTVENFYPKMALTMYAAGGIWVKMQETEVKFG